MKRQLIFAALFGLLAPAAVQAQNFLAQNGDGPALAAPAVEQAAEELPLSPAPEARPLENNSQAAPAPYYAPRIQSPVPGRPFRQASAPMADPYYNHGINFGNQCCETGDPCARGLWGNYCADKVLWCNRQHRRAAACNMCNTGNCGVGSTGLTDCGVGRCGGMGLCPSQPYACVRPVHGCDSSLGSLPDNHDTLDRLHLSAPCPTCGPSNPSRGAWLFGGIWSAFHGGGCQNGCGDGRCGCGDGNCGCSTGNCGWQGQLPGDFDSHEQSHAPQPSGAQYQEYMPAEPKPAPAAAPASSARRSLDLSGRPRLSSYRSGR
ncbi:hypothetical protein [Lignipirellula cremea]|uniref:Stigma-specific protein, Stig1 n=1 Tax=Lignipirellula cremea TaxID=2528010 RepID=A0A518DMS6_9BACT|nr:hypothetical protein [Lignipirellula cremea]QDU93138.1 hypothetical protein Pla8534_09170 [Lignipirellula cremea]